MSATLVSSNTTIKVNAAVDTTRTSDGTVYTGPSNGYAIVNIELNNTGSGSVTISDGTIDVLTVGVSASARLFGYYLGPGLALSVTFAGGATGNAILRGISFVNTP